MLTVSTIIIPKQYHYQNLKASYRNGNVHHRNGNVDHRNGNVDHRNAYFIIEIKMLFIKSPYPIVEMKILIKKK